MAIPDDLVERHRIEKSFHDSIARSQTTDFYSFGALDLPDRFLKEQLGDLRGKRIVEIGCGDGRTSVEFAKAGADVVALDVSAEMVAVTAERARAEGLSGRVSPRELGIEQLDLPDESCDVVYGHSVLHHLDLEVAMPLIARVLRSGGKAAFLDPLDHNPVLNWLRRLTPHMRTPTEKPLSLDDISFISKFFSRCERTEFHFLALGAFVFYYVVRNERLFRASLDVLSVFDRWLFARIPLFRRFAWVTVLTFTK